MKIKLSGLGYYSLLLGLVLAFSVLSAQEINWHSIDNGGGVSSNGDVKLIGVIGQADVIRLEGGSVTIAGGFLPLPADLIFENKFD